MWMWLVACGGGEPLPTATVTRAEFSRVVSLKGEAQAVDALEVEAPLRGRNTIAFLAEDGSRVAAGDKLLEIETTELKKDLTEQRARLELLQTRVEQGLASRATKLRDADAKLLTAQLDAHLAELRISASEAVPRVERVSSQFDAQRATMDEDLARSERRRTQLEAGGDLELLAVEMVEAEAKIARLESDIAKATVHAPTDGTVLVQSNWNGTYRSGSKVWGGRTILQLPDLSKVQVVAWAHEVDSPLVREDQDVRIRLDADESTVVDGRVEQIGAIAETHGEHGLPHLRVRVGLAAVPDKLKPGMAVTVDVRLPRVEVAAWVPADAVFASNDGPVVYDAATLVAVPVDVLGEQDGRIAVTTLDASHVLLVDPRVRP